MDEFLKNDLKEKILRIGLAFAGLLRFLAMLTNATAKEAINLIEQVAVTVSGDHRAVFIE